MISVVMYFVPPKFIHCDPHLQGDSRLGFGMWLGHGSRALKNVVALSRRPKNPLSSYTV